MLLMATQGNGLLSYVGFVYVLLLCPAVHRNIMKVYCTQCCLMSFNLKVLKNKKNYFYF